MTNQEQFRRAPVAAGKAGARAVRDDAANRSADEQAWMLAHRLIDLA
jgi:hypothetical protein